MDDDEDFEAWKICWEVDRSFQVKRDVPLKNEVTCLGCGEEALPWSAKHRSEYPACAIKCSAGHLDARLTLHSTEMCARCNQDFVLKTVKREKICPDEGCRRVLLIKESIITERLKRKPLTTAAFLSLVKKHNAFDCLIHGDSVHLSEVSQPLANTGCNHEPNICPDCLRQSLETAISAGRLNDVRCPDTDCAVEYSLPDLRTIISKGAFDEYNRQCTIRAMTQDENHRRCRAVVNGKGCENRQIVARSSRDLEWKCTVCKTYNCFDCSADICERHQSQRGEDVENAKEIRKICKKCPRRGCAIPINFRSGCAHMTCREDAGGCGAHFCWICKVIWQTNLPGEPRTFSPGHLESCRLYKKRPVPKPLSSDPIYAPGWDSDPGYDTSLDIALWLPRSQI